ncbi:MAG TPA: Nif11-like leader peptide family RiPP precursor [Bryobacteraceae bacterium]|jgi:predicted ribosomally synthesized peptide with nif11-like leader|nr:Nif11-like leader peptide family RiPP precursor [Bryobacteraceae bacterium]
MQIDQWTAFIASVSNDAEAEDVLKSGDVAKIAMLAQSRGFNFTERDIEDANLESGALGEEILERISGAMRGIFR